LWPREACVFFWVLREPWGWVLATQTSGKPDFNEPDDKVFIDTGLIALSTFVSLSVNSVEGRVSLPDYGTAPIVRGAKPTPKKEKKTNGSPEG
jgi:hypothetical protein